VNVGRATEALTLQKPLVVASLSILAHGSMPWESRTMVAVAVQGAPVLALLCYPRRCQICPKVQSGKAARALA
jgi:hypothetical protein